NIHQLAPRPFANASKFNGDHKCHAEISNQTPWLIIYASQTGFAEQIAWRTAQSLHQAEITTQVIPIHQLNVAQLHSAKKALFVVSTYGQGQAPDHARPFAKKQLKQPLDLSGLDYAVLALGDQEYQDT
ncbi:flavodoxin family protein, partial [Rhizobium hidalgonense]